MSRYDELIEVEKRYDEIEEVAKFNQNHGWHGRFVSAADAGASGGGGPSFGGSSTEKFTKACATAKANMAKERPDAAWRVTDMSKEEFESEHPGAKMHVTEGGSTIAITQDGDIVSVAKNPEDTVRGKELIEMAVKNGGTKLDSYDGNHGFYTKCGFEPVSWCKWDDNGADEGWISQDWLKANGLPSDISTAELSKIPNSQLAVPREDIIFYKYTGKRSQYEDADDFKRAVNASSDYGEAQKNRDDSMK